MQDKRKLDLDPRLRDILSQYRCVDDFRNGVKHTDGDKVRFGENSPPVVSYEKDFEGVSHNK